MTVVLEKARLWQKGSLEAFNPYRVRGDGEDFCANYKVAVVAEEGYTKHLKAVLVLSTKDVVMREDC